MALEYTFYLVTERKLQEIVELMFESINIKYKIEKSTELNVITSTIESGFLIYITYASQFQRLLIKEELDINEPNIHIIFRLDKFQNGVVLKKSLILFIKSILNKTQGDCVALFNHEQVLLIRALGKISINQNSNFWSNEYLELLGKPFEIKYFNIF